MQEVILVVPCYNEAERFDSGGFADFLAEQPGYALLFVDDGSSDRTPERLEALRKRQPGQVSGCGGSEPISAAPRCGIWSDASSPRRLRCT